MLTWILLCVMLGVIAGLLWFLWTLVQGAPFVPSHRHAIEEVVELAALQPGERVAELGSGDGRLAIALARSQPTAIVVGFEINPLLVWVARRRVRRARVGNRVSIRRANFWKEDLGQYDVVTVFGIPHVMERLGRQLTRTARPGSRAVSNAFPIPGLKLDARTTRALRYVVPKR